MDFPLVLCYNLTMETLKKRSLFWDVENIDAKKNAKFVIGRVLSLGDEKDFRWALKNYGEKKMKEVFLLPGSLDKKSNSFWCNYFEIDPIECMQKQSKMV